MVVYKSNFLVQFIVIMGFCITVEGIVGQIAATQLEGSHRANRPRKPSSTSSSNRNKGTDTNSDYSGLDYSEEGNWTGDIINSRKATAEEKLLRTLFKVYSRDARAGLDSTKTVLVEIQFLMLRIQALDERTQVLTTVGLVITEWIDERLVWDPLKYDNLSSIVLPPTMIWLPELTLMNGAENMAHDFDRMGVVVSNDGHVHWEPGGIFMTTCDIDISYFPFDNQECSVIVGAWAYYTQMMNLTNSSSETPLRDYTVNGAWEITNTSVKWGETKLPCCPDTRYAYVESTIKLRRRVQFYFMNIMVPCFMLSVLTLVTFWIPPEAGEKISCGISVLLAFTVFLLMVSENVPKTSLQMPIIAIYLMSTMFLGASSLAFSIVVLNIHFTDSHPVPHWIQVLVLTLMGSILCVNTRTVHTKSVPYMNHIHDNDESFLDTRNELRRYGKQYNIHRKERLSRSRSTLSSCSLSSETMANIHRDIPYFYHVPDWRDVAHVLDRLFFCIVLFSMFIVSLVTIAGPYFNS